MPNHHHRSSQNGGRPIDRVTKGVTNQFKNTGVLVRKTRLNTWRGAFLGLFLVGVTVAVVTTLYFKIQNTSEGALGSTLSLVPATLTTAVGDPVTLNVMLNTNGNPVVVAQAVILYDPALFRLQTWDTAQHAFTNTQCVYQGKSCEIVTHDSTQGKLSITLAKPSPGVNTASGRIANLTFQPLKAVTPNTPNIRLDYVTSGSLTDSNVVMGDGKEILNAVSGARVTVTGSSQPPTPTPSPTPTPNPTPTDSITMGEKELLSINDSDNGNQLFAQRTTLSQTATFQSLSFYVTTPAGNLRLGVYDDTGPNGGPGKLKAQTNNITPVAGWNTANVATPISLTAGTYWLAYLGSSNNLGFKAEKTGGTSKGYSFTFGAMPATFSTTPSSSGWYWSFYATLNTTLPSPTTTLTIGETNILATDDSNNANVLLAQPTTLSQSATIQSLSFYVTAPAGSLRLGVYDATGPSGGPGKLKAQTNSVTPKAGWNTASVMTPASLPAGTYWLAYLPSSNALKFKWNPASGVHKKYAYTFGPLPATFSRTPGGRAGHWSFYATMNTAPR